MAPTYISQSIWMHHHLDADANVHALGCVIHARASGIASHRTPLSRLDRQASEVRWVRCGRSASCCMGMYHHAAVQAICCFNLLVGPFSDPVKGYDASVLAAALSIVSPQCVFELYIYSARAYIHATNSLISFHHACTGIEKLVTIIFK